MPKLIKKTYPFEVPAFPTLQAHKPGRKDVGALPIELPAGQVGLTSHLSDQLREREEIILRLIDYFTKS